MDGCGGRVDPTSEMKVSVRLLRFRFNVYEVRGRWDHKGKHFASDVYSLVE